jgi:hypothetical protein
MRKTKKKSTPLCGMINGIYGSKLMKPSLNSGAQEFIQMWWTLHN